MFQLIHDVLSAQNVTDLGRFLGLTLMRVTAILGIAFLLVRFGRIRSAALRHTIWTSALVGCLLVPVASAAVQYTQAYVWAIPVPLEVSVDHAAMYWMGESTAESPSAGMSPAASSNTNRDAEVTVDAAATPLSSAAASEWSTDLGRNNPESASLGFRFVLGVLAVWVMGVFFLVARLVHGLVSVFKLRRSATPCDDPTIRSLTETHAGHFRLKRCPAVLCSDTIGGPVVTGYLRPVIVLPRDMVSELNRQEWRDVLCHELGHLERGDRWIGLFQRLVAILYWPHPLVHRLNNVLNAAREELCDNYSLREGDRHRYSRLLLRIAQSPTRWHVLPGTSGILTPRSWLEQRIAGVLDETRNLALSTGVRQRWTVFAVLFAAIAITAGATMRSLSHAAAVERLQDLGMQFTGGNGQSGDTLRAMILPEWRGTPLDMEDLSAVNDLQDVWIAGLNHRELRLRDIESLNRITFVTSFYDNAQHRQMMVPRLPVATISLSNLPELSQIHLNSTQVTHLEMSEMTGVTDLRAEGSQVGNGVLSSVDAAPNLEHLVVSRTSLSNMRSGRTHVTDAGLKAITHLKHLKTLDLSGGKITDAGVGELAVLKHLTGLGLSGSEITDASVDALLSMKKLQGLGISDTRITDAGLKRLVQGLPNLTFLQLAGADISADGLKILADLPKLVSLSVHAAQLTPESCAVLSALPELGILTVHGESSKPGMLSGLPQVHMLMLQGTQRLQFAPDSLPGLKSLYVRGADAETTAAICRHFRFLPQLTSLEIACGWNDEGAIPESPVLHLTSELFREITHLKSLNFLWINPAQEVNDVDVQHLRNLVQLKGVLLNKADITDSGASVFADLPLLERVELSGTQVSDGGLMHFSRLPNLKELMLNNTNVTEEGARAFRQQHPGVNIQGYTLDL